MRAPLLALASLVATAAPAFAQAPATAASVTELWHGMDRVMDLVLAPDAAEAQSERTIVLLLDVTPALARSGFADAVATAFTRHATALGKTRFGVARVGVERPLLLPSEDRSAVLTAVRQALEAPSDKIQNVYADLRAIALLLRGRPGSRTILLASLDNGDAEDELDATVSHLEASHVHVHVLATEAYLADSWWAARPYERAPRGAKMTGGDAAFIDLPWGWLFQITVANEVAPSGFATYGLNRIAAASEGKVFLYAPPDTTGHRCAIYGGCLFCSGDHCAESEIYVTARVQPLASSTKPRAAVAAELGADPFFRATTSAWRAAAQAGLVRSQPPRLGSTASSGGGGGLDRTGLLLSTSFERNAERADALAKEAERILAALDAELSRIEPAKGSARQRAIAELTRIELQLAVVNLVTFAGWCREIAPGWAARENATKEPEPPAPPELPPIDRDQRSVGIGYTNYCLCHGARPFLEVELPGGARLREELLRLDTMATKYLASWAQSPFAVALHRQSIARFHLTYPGVVTAIEREKPKSKTAPDPTTGGARPARTAPTTGGGATGPTTGSGK